MASKGRGYVVEKPAGSGNWYVVLSVRDPATGKRAQKWFSGYRSKKEAERGRTEKLRTIDAGTWVDPSKVTVREYFEGAGARPGWMEGMRHQVRPATWAAYESHIRVHVVPRIGGLRLQQLSAAHLNALYGELLTAGLKPKSVRNVAVVLGRALRDAEKERLIQHNPTTAAQMPSKGHAALEVPDAQFVRDILERERGSAHGDVTAFIAGTGCRRGEALALRWTEVDLDAREAAVIRQLVRVGNRVIEGEPKSAKGRRRIHLPPTLVEQLRARRREQAARRLAAGAAWQDAGLVFDRGDGGALDPDAYTKWFVRTAKRAGSPGVRVHDLRHFYATHALKAGVPVKVVSEQLGHATASLTMDFYAHLIKGMGQMAADAIEAAVWGSGTRQSERR